MARPGNPYIQVSWDETADARKVGYRVYRSDDGGPYLPVGSSFVNGFVDLNANLGHNYRYAVTFYSYYGLESPVSASYPVTAKFIRVYLPVVRNR
jgi:fibronectin type 3 domain-containing protein